MTTKVLKSNEPTKAAIRKAHYLPANISRKYPDRKKPYISSSQFKYNGYFKLLKKVDDSGDATYSIVDGANLESVYCGYATINNQTFQIPKYNGSPDQYIWLQGGNGDDPPPEDGGFNIPTIYTSDTYPEYEDGFCKILIGRIIDGETYQEHHGAIHGFVLGLCVEVEDY